jgi:hypothetical protein
MQGVLNPNAWPCTVSPEVTCIDVHGGVEKVMWQDNRIENE